MAQETYDWSIDYSDENSGATTTFTSTTGDTVDVTVSQPDPNGWYRSNRDGFESNTQMGGNNTGYFEMGVNYPNTSATLTTTIDFSNNTTSLANSVTDVSFTLYDIDATSTNSFQDQVTVLAYDVDGNLLTVTMTAVDPSIVSVTGGVATAIPGAGSGPSGSVAAGSTEGNVLVSISGEVAYIEIIYGSGPLAQSNPANQAIGFGDLSFDLTPPVVCFVRGTRIRTQNGQTPIEELRVGDLVMTADNGLRPVLWVGARKVAGHGELAPVRFQKGVIGNRRDLAVSPRHKMVVGGWKAQLLFGEDEVLVDAIHLINGTTIIQTKQDVVEYFHVMLDRHEVIYAEGTKCETLFISERSLKALDAMVRDELAQMFPDLLINAPADFGVAARVCLRAYEAQLMT